MSTVTPQALEVIRRSLDLAGYDPAEVGVRLRVAGGQVRPRFVPEPQTGDEVVEMEGIRIFIDRVIVEELGQVEVTTSAEHDTLEVRAK